MSLLSIIIPAFNEKENIAPLVSRIHTSCIQAGLKEEIIFVDDHSTDGTKEEIIRLSKIYPIVLLEKNGPRGKAESLLQGFQSAKSELMVMIDADLQYPPEAIPQMAAMVLEGKADIVIAERERRNTSFLRSLASKVYHYAFAYLLLRLPYDTQSGLKVFRKSVIEHIDIRSSGWMFDLNFIFKAKEAGYTIHSFSVFFAKRNAGREKISIVKTSIQMGLNALHLKLQGRPVIPFTKEKLIKSGKGFIHKGKEYVHHTNLSLNESAYYRLTSFQYGMLAGIISAFIISFLVNWHSTLIVVIAMLTTLYFIDLCFQIFLVLRSFKTSREISYSDKEIESVSTANLPIYTVFCPLYKEWHVIPQFIKAMRQMDYPKNKLQVMLLLEEDDKDSISHVDKMKLPAYFEVRIVPHSNPKTKPKALNFGLQFAKGEYAVIYDAEDIPDPLQLKKAVLAFKKVSNTVICLQAKLNFYNPDQNLLTRLFTAEYSLWFDLILPGLQSLKAPIPLGGTSNHFRVKDLHRLHGWDAFNVTEDCDLGMRLSKHRLNTAIIDSTTMEEANSKIVNWYGQRSRWIKGYIQTYFVHARDAHKFSWNFRQPDGMFFHLIVGGKILSMFVNPLLWFITILYFTLRPVVGETIESFYPGPVLYMGVLSLIFGNFIYMYAYMIGCVNRGHYHLIKYALLTPAYWLAMSMAAWRALTEMIYNPFYWRKTAHGFHLQEHKYVRPTKKSQRLLHRIKNIFGIFPNSSARMQRMKNLPSYCDILTSA